MKPLFIPLKGEHYDRFESGDKDTEYRQYGPRWNEQNCPPGRTVILSRGYGKQHRLTGTVEQFQRQQLNQLPPQDQEALHAIYGPSPGDIASISIHVQGIHVPDEELPF